MNAIQIKKAISIWFLILIPMHIIAQENKPTKEQTVQYIKDYFTDLRLEEYCIDKGTDIIRFQDLFHVDFDFSKNIIIIKHRYERIYEYNSEVTSFSFKHIQEYKIDISKIENLSLYMSYDQYVHNCRKSIGKPEEFLLYIEFQAVSGYGIECFDFGKRKNEKKIQIPIAGPFAINNFSANKDDYKIIKAFEHLRKLCGAPEPIEFEE